MLDDNWHSEDNSRLACQIHLNEQINNLKVRLAPED
jgi:ferredoxin